jgi:hypothetical protein
MMPSFWETVRRISAIALGDYQHLDPLATYLQICTFSIPLKEAYWALGSRLLSRISADADP